MSRELPVRMKNGLRFLSTLSSIFLLVMFVRPDLNIIFLFLHLFSYIFFLFLLPLSTFEPLNALYSKFDRLKISGNTFVRQKLGDARLGDPPQSGHLKF